MGYMTYQIADTIAQGVKSAYEQSILAEYAAQREGFDKELEARKQKAEAEVRLEEAKNKAIVQAMHRPAPGERQGIHPPRGDGQAGHWR